jgi:hypothetical protein
MVQTGDGEIDFTTVVAVGFRVEPFLLEETPAVCLPLGPEHGELTELYDDLVETVPEGAGVVVIVPRRWREPAARRLRTVQLASERPPFAFYETDLPPLAGGVLAELAAALGSRMAHPGSLVASLPRIERELIWVTWLGSINRLREPSPSLRDRLASLLARRRFVVTNWPEPAIHAARERRPVPPMPELLTEFHLAVAAGRGDSGWARYVAAALGDIPSREYEPSPLGPAWWGTEQFVETVAYPIDVAALAEYATSGLVTARCHWCGQAIAGSPCPLCGHARGPIRAEPPESGLEQPRVVVA